MSQKSLSQSIFPTAEFVVGSGNLILFRIRVSFEVSGRIKEEACDGYSYKARRLQLLLNPFWNGLFLRECWDVSLKEGQGLVWRWAVGSCCDVLLLLLLVSLVAARRWEALMWEGMMQRKRRWCWWCLMQPPHEPKQDVSFRHISPDAAGIHMSCLVIYLPTGLTQVGLHAVHSAAVCTESLGVSWFHVFCTDIWANEDSGRQWVYFLLTSTRWNTEAIQMY